MSLYNNREIAKTAVDQLARQRSMFTSNPFEQCLREIEKRDAILRMIDKINLPHFTTVNTGSIDRLEAQQHLSIGALSSFQSAYAASRAVANALSTMHEKFDIERIISISKPWDNAISAIQSPALSPLTAVLDSLTGARSYLPLIDEANLSQIASHWHRYGVGQDVRVLSDLYEKLLKDDAPSECEIEMFSRNFAQFSEKKGQGFSEFLNLLLMLVNLWYQEDSSRRMEERLMTKIEAGQAQQFQNDTETKVLLTTIIRGLEHIQPTERGHTVLVVRDQVAPVTNEALSGAKVISSMVPNQTAILLEEKNDWIRVKYFDWYSQTAQQGWVLKKHLSIAQINGVD